MRLFKKRYMCVLCNSYRDESRALFSHKGICVCRDCYNMTKTGGDYTYFAKEPLSAVISPFDYDGLIKKAVKRYKFGSQRVFGVVMGKMLSAELKNHPYLDGCDFVIPVPLHNTRLVSRGYNQAEIIAEAFSCELGLSCVTDAIFRIKKTKQQSSLRGIDRVENVKSAFYACEDVVKGKRIILVDDICTKGETMASAARALKDAGADTIVGVALCKTQYKERIFLR